MENPPGASKRKCTEYFQPIIIKKERWSSAEEQYDINVSEIGEDSIDIKSEPIETESTVADLPAPEKATSSTVCWTTQSDSMRDIKFESERHVRFPIPSDPYEAFRLILTDDWLRRIVRETNINARKIGENTRENSRMKAYTDLTVDELITFLGLILHMGSIRQNRARDYWNIHWLFNIPCFGKYMSRKRFVTIQKCLTSEESKSRRVRENMRDNPFISYFNERMNYLYSPGRDLIIEDGMVMWKGATYFREDAKTKPLVGNRLRVLADTEGVAMKVHLSGGNMFKCPNEKVVLHLLEEKLDYGHCVYMGGRLNSCELAVQLLNRDTHCTGTLSRMSKDLPQELKTATLGPGDNRSLFANGVHVGKWKQRLPVYYISTEYGDQLDGINTPKSQIAVQPSALTKYKETMSTVELQDFMMSFYPLLNQEKKRTRWETKLFLHILQMSLNNAFLLHAMDTSRVKTTSAGAAAAFCQFRLKVLERMLPRPSNLAPSPIESMGFRHALTKITSQLREKKFKDPNKPSILVLVPVRKDCVRCRQEGRKGRGTPYDCKGCPGAPGYCVECFFKVH